MHDAADVFADDVEFEVDGAAHLNLVEVGVLVGVGMMATWKLLSCEFAHGEAHPVDGDRTLLDGHVALWRPSWGRGRRRRCSSGCRRPGRFARSGRLVYVALHDVSVEAAVHEHAALEIHLVAYLQRPQVGAVESLLYGGHGVAVAVDVDHGEAHAVVGDALVYFQFVGKRTFKREMQIAVIAVRATMGAASSTIPENIIL